jgi:predicted GNAT family acetyltransferase
MDGLISNEHSKATVKASNAFPVGVMEISGVFTEPVFRKQGYATKLLKQIADTADSERIVLCLMCENELVNWYKPLGFATIQQNPIIMARMPQIFKVKMTPIAQAADKAING